MVRITYISTTTRPISNKEIETIGIKASQNNKQINVTGLLVYFEKMFYQIIEGDEVVVDRLFQKIEKDDRHKDVLRLKTEKEINERLFPNWSMNVVNLDNKSDDLLRPIKILLRTVVESHSMVAQYTQPTILKTLNHGLNPLNVAPIRVEKIILFADIVSYTSISEKIPVEETFLLLNTYFEICSRIILKNGGEVNKFMGDGLMAYFDNGFADNAIHACLEIMVELRDLRQNSKGDSPLQFINSGFGIAQGYVIEGNMGSPFKTDFTIIGEAVNLAARLEGLTRVVSFPLVLSESLKKSTKESWDFISLGKHTIKGIKNNTEIYSINHDLIHKR